MNVKTVIYGNPNDIEIFDNEKEESIIIENGKLLSTEPYVEDLLELYNESFTKLPKNIDYQIGQVITGVIKKISECDILLDINSKDFAYISLSKDKLNPQSYKIGEEINAIIIDNTSYLKASITEYVMNSLYSEMKNKENNTIYDAKVLSLTENGYILDIDGVQVFMPGSLGGINKLLDFESLIGKTIKVLTINNENKYSKYKDQLIVSHRAYLETLIPNEIDKLELGNVYTGKITGTKPFGIFVEFNNVLTGMIHKDEFDDILIDTMEKGNAFPGVEIDFYLKEIVSNRKLILSRFPVSLEENSKPKFEKNDIVDGKVIKCVKYGCFVSLHKNATGLIHISKLKNKHDLKKDDVVSVKILDNKDNRYVLELT